MPEKRLLQKKYLPTQKKPCVNGEESIKVAKISFTGSTNVGKILMNQCADSLKKMSLELGGNALPVYYGDAGLEISHGDQYSREI